MLRIGFMKLTIACYLHLFIHNNFKDNDWIILSISICTSGNGKFKALYKVSSQSSKPYWDRWNSNWILLFWQYAHLQMAVKHYTKFEAHRVNWIWEVFVSTNRLRPTILLWKQLDHRVLKICSATNEFQAYSITNTREEESKGFATDRRQKVQKR